jgi:hypothetical protein
MCESLRRPAVSRKLTTKGSSEAGIGVNEDFFAYRAFSAPAYGFSWSSSNWHFGGRGDDRLFQCNEGAQDMRRMKHINADDFFKVGSSEVINARERI